MMMKSPGLDDEWTPKWGQENNGMFVHNGNRHEVCMFVQLFLELILHTPCTSLIVIELQRTQPMIGRQWCPLVTSRTRGTDGARRSCGAIVCRRYSIIHQLVWKEDDIC